MMRGALLSNPEEIKQTLSDENISADDFVSILSYYNSTYDDSIVQEIDKLPPWSKDEICDTLTKKILESVHNGNEEAVQLLCNELYNATADKWGTADEFVEYLFKNATDQDLASIMDKYKEVNNSDIYTDIKNDFSGKKEDEYLQRLDEAYKNARGKEFEQN